MRHTLATVMMASFLLMACDNSQDDSGQNSGGVPAISTQKSAKISTRPNPEQAALSETARAAEAEEKARREAERRMQE